MASAFIFLLLSFCTISLASPIMTTKTGESRENTTDSEEAKVEEIPQPAMTVQNGQQYDYRLPGFYTFNNGEPFFVEKDPLTGAIDFNKKTKSTAPDGQINQQETDFTSESKKDRVKEGVEDDYLYDEESDQQFSDDQIDRKDTFSNSNNYRPNDILKNPYKVSPDLHQFLNLPVHYSSSDKFPLISSSYANTKIQGTGSSSYSNHKYVSTTTQSPPSYYTFRQTTTTERPTTTTKWTTTTTTTTEIPEEEYENPDELSYMDYDMEEQFENQPAEIPTTRPPVTNTTITTTTTQKYPITTYRPTTTTTVTPTPTITTEGKQTQRVSIVTSLPLDIYYSTQETPTTSHLPTTSTTTILNTTTTETTKSKETSPSSTVLPESPTTERYTTQPQNQYYRPNEQFYHVVDEPFRPIFGPGGQPAQSHLVNRPGTGVNNFNQNVVKHQNESYHINNTSRIPGFQRLPENQSSVYSQRPSTPPKIIGIEPPKPDPPQSFFSEQPIKLVPGQHATVTFSEPPKTNTIMHPIQDHGNSGNPHLPIYHTSQEQSPSFTRPDNVRPNYQANNPANVEPLLSNKPKPDEVIYPQQRPMTGVTPQNYASKPIPPSIIDVLLPKQQPGQFKQPTKVQNHFIKVSPDQENPSYSLQTSFSIGVPPAETGQNEEQHIRPGQGIGQVLFPDDNSEPSSPTEVTGHVPPQRLRRPIQTYQPNRPGLRQPIHVEPPIGGLRPPVPGDNYPRPHWETHSKPAFYNGPTQNTLAKHDVQPPHYSGLNRVKPDGAIVGHDLPNILPQFRPNAKIGLGDYHVHLSPPVERPREPLDTLQPPPLPRPQHLRINRNDEDSEIDEDVTLNEKSSTPFPLVHHRTGPQANARVTTLQMMQQSPPRRTILRPDYQNSPKNTTPEKDRPVFLVYPSSNFPKKHSPSEGGVIIGTRGPQRPLPPSNLEKDELDTFPLDDNKNFPIPGRDRVDTPILKTKSTPKPIIKHEFPYTIIRPDEKNVPEERILSGNTGTKEYNAFSPTATPNKDEIKDHDSEINIIPYLQDYMPFAMKKQTTTLKPASNTNKDNKLSKPLQGNQSISATLYNLATTTSKLNPTTERNILEQKPSSSYHESIVKGSGESEFTVSAVMHTHQQQRPLNHRPTETTVNEAPSQPKPIDLEAPFQASLSAPESHGWNVVRPSGEQGSNGNDRIDEVDAEVFSKKPDEESKFDIENFKPQLFGGFKPIIPQITDKLASDSDSNVRDKHELNIYNGERQEKKL